MEPLMVASVAALALFAVILCIRMNRSSRLAVAGFLAVPQMFIPGVPMSVAEAWILLVGVVGLLEDRGRMRMAALSILAALIVVMGLSLLWSAPESIEPAALLILRHFLFLLIVREVMVMASTDVGVINRMARLAAPWIALQSVLVIVFRSNQAIEMQFLNSPIGSMLVGPSAAALFNGQENNVLDPAKAGGLFVNGNVASMFNGVAFFVLLIVANRTRSKVLGLTALLSLAAAVTTGSKTGIGLAVILVLVAVLVPPLLRGRTRLLVVPIVAASIPIAMFGSNAIMSLFPTYVDDSSTSLGTRSFLWDAAGHLFADHPLLGLGFGGWRRSIAAYVGTDDFPPHNVVIAAWANSGLLAAVLTIGFMLVVVILFVRTALAASTAVSRRAVVYGMCAFLWVFAHGMGDNTSIFGEPRTGMLLAIAFGSLHVLSTNKGGSENAGISLESRAPDLLRR